MSRPIHARLLALALACLPATSWAAPAGTVEPAPSGVPRAPISPVQFIFEGLHFTLKNTSSLDGVLVPTKAGPAMPTLADGREVDSADPRLESVYSRLKELGTPLRLVPPSNRPPDQRMLEKGQPVRSGLAVARGGRDSEGTGFSPRTFLQKVRDVLGANGKTEIAAMSAIDARIFGHNVASALLGRDEAPIVLGAFFSTDL